MHKKDQIKSVAALILFGSIAITYFLFDKGIAKWVAIISLIVWLGIMYYLNQRKDS